MVLRRIEDLSRGSLPETINADVCIVGSGAAGLPLAITLANQGANVVLLESGGARPDTPEQDFNHGEIVGLPHIGIHEGRNRALGGTTTMWGGQILPLEPIDFESRPWVPESGWPISYAELSPFYRDAIHFSGLSRSLQTDTEVWRALGLTVPNLGDGIESYVSRFCPEPNFARSHGREVGRLPLLRCILHATVVGFEAQGDQITCAVARASGGQSVHVRSRHFVLCVGGIETARLLLHPLIDGRPAPWATSDLIGRFFQDHPGISSADIVPWDRGAVHQLFDNIYYKGFKYGPRFRLSAVQQRKSQLPGVGGSILFQSDRTALLYRARFAGKSLLKGDINREVVAAAIGAAKSGPLLARQSWRTLVQYRAYNLDDRGFRLGIQLEQVPLRDSSVSLSDQTDALGLRRPRLDWRMSEIDIESIARFTEITKEGFEQAGVARVHIDPDVADRSSAILARTQDQYHHMGTARMAATPERGVVDQNLRLFGTDNAYVCGSAVFPTSGYSNPTHTIIALALRLSDHVLARLTGG